MVIPHESGERLLCGGLARVLGAREHKGGCFYDVQYLHFDEERELGPGRENNLSHRCMGLDDMWLEVVPEEPRRSTRCRLGKFFVVLDRGFRVSIVWLVKNRSKYLS